MDGGFNDVVGAVGEEDIGVLNVAEGVAVCYQVGSVNLAFGNQVHDFVAVAGIDAACLERQILAVHPGQWQYLFFLVERDNRDDGIWSGTTPCEFKRLLASGNLNDAVGTTTLCQ